MTVLKALSVLVVVAGMGILVILHEAAAPSASGRAFEAGQTDRADGRHTRRELTFLAGRGAEIGVSVRDLEASDKARAGVVIDEVRPDSPAEQAGLKPSDVVVEFDGEAVRSARQFTRLVQETPPRRSVKMTVLREGARKDVQITPTAAGDGFVLDGDRLRERLGDAWRMYERMPPFNFDFDLPSAFDGRGRLGVSVQDLTPQLAAYFGVKEGVLVTAVTEDGPGARGGLKAGDVITKVNGTAVRSHADLVRELRGVQDEGQTTIGLVRDKKEMTINVKFETRRLRTVRPAEPV
jgi:C-terminal processing protease CtpA/Prc